MKKETMSALPLLCFLVIVLWGSASTLFAAVPATGDWQTIITQPGEVIDINSATIERGASDAKAWSRVVLDRLVNADEGGYDSIQVQNLYECSARRLKALRRVYFRGDTLVREEPIVRSRSNAVMAGSLDERMFRVACAPARGTLRNLAASPTSPPASSDTANIMLVTDKAASIRPQKPSLIVLPQIDTADMAAANQAAASVEQKPRELASSSASPSPVNKTSPVVSSPRLSKPSAVPTAPSPSVRVVENQADRRLRELRYANSGPSKIVKKDLVGNSPAYGQEKFADTKQGNWSYEGDTGPAHWAKLSKDYALCATGKRQSPIDIQDGIKVDLEEIVFDYKPTPVRIVDTGRAVRVNVASGLGLRVSGKQYELMYFNFHYPAEQRMAGRLYDMEVQLVHKNSEGQLAVVALLLEQGLEHPLIQSVLNNLPLDQDIEMTPAEVMDIGKLLPEKRTYWTYMGSLSRPPCTEGVLWMVFKQPIQVSAAQVAIFSRLYRHNVRPLQPAHNRMIKESR
ncbi:MAG: surface-adhesin E family protein [Rugosibacter sp.]